MSKDKRAYIVNYFQTEEIEIPTLKRYAKYGTLLLFIGILFLWLQAKEYIGNFSIISIVFILTGLVSTWLLIKPLISKNAISGKAEDGDMDLWFSDDMHDIIKLKALDQLKINPSSLKDENIIIVPYPVYWNLPNYSRENIKRKQGDDGSFIYSVWVVQILVVTDNFISYYACYYDWLNQFIFNERTNEYFFEDISSVSNDVIPTGFNSIENEEQAIGEAKVFNLTNMSSEKLTIITDIPSLNVPEGYSNNLERLVQAVRILLRHRRFGETVEMPAEKIYDTGDVEFEIENKKSQSDKHFFHQQLRELYNEYNQTDNSEN